MRFEYQAIDENGGIIRGMVDAKSLEKVLQILLHKQLHPLDIRPLTESTVELNRLNNLKQKLQGKETKTETKLKSGNASTQFEHNPEPSKKIEIDWTYIIFIIMISGLLATAAYLG